MTTSPERSRLRILKIGLLVFFVVILAASSASAALLYGYGKYYSGRVLPGVSIGSVALDGMTETQATRAVHTEIKRATENGLRFVIEDDTIILPLDQKKNGFVYFDADAGVRAALAYGQSSVWWKIGWERLRLRFHRVTLSLPYQMDAAAVEQVLQTQLSSRLPSVQNAQIHVSFSDDAKEPIITFTDAVVGKSVDLSSIADRVSSAAKNLDFPPIKIPVMRIEPQWTVQDVQPLAADVKPLLAHAPFRLTAERQYRVITLAQLANWITIATSTNGPALSLDPVRVSNDLRAFVSPYLDEPTDGSLAMQDGKITSFVPPSDGVRFDADETVANMLAAFQKQATSTRIELPRVAAHILGPDAERLGLKELLGVGRSNFSGSPTNRRKNIAHGAEKVNETLVAPGKEFSMLKTLGDIDGKNGWLPELVIKGNKTVPEFGGGLCQIGTTMFRAALASGMPITERQNHSYRVRYYEPAGTDATIYDPAPDFRFKNDTNGWLLVTTKIKGDDVAFSVWGTNDGRIAEQTDPNIYHIVPPPEKKIVETTTIPVGTTKCTEVAHAGADAKFDYTVVYPNGEKKKTTFASHYRPWGAVCLLGVVSTTNSTNVSEKIDETGVNNPN